MAEARVEDIYGEIKRMAVGFRLRPGDRLNEGALARSLGVSRTPLREALNRLVAERMVEFRPGSGFFCRTLEPQAIFDLYELRGVVEAATVRLACQRAPDAALGALKARLYESGLVVAGLTIAEATARDEAFHNGIAQAAGNAEMAAQLERINERIRYIRWVSMSMGTMRNSKAEHIAIMAALLDRDSAQAVAVVTGHIARRLDQITAAVREGITNIYMDQAGALAEQVLEEDA